jgi:hypothetical protein
MPAATSRFWSSRPFQTLRPVTNVMPRRQAEAARRNDVDPARDREAAGTDADGVGVGPDSVRLLTAIDIRPERH